MPLHTRIGANVGTILAFAIAVSFFLPVVTDANKTYVSHFSSDNYSLYRAPYSNPHVDGWQPETTPEIIHRRRVEGEESSIKQTETKAETPDVPEGTTGLLNFRAASLPDEIQKEVGAITDEYMLLWTFFYPKFLPRTTCKSIKLETTVSIPTTTPRRRPPSSRRQACAFNSTPGRFVR